MNLIDKYFPVLDNGFVALKDYMGGDDAIVQAARVSYGKGTKKVREDRGLIRYLLRQRHTSPLEQVELKFHIKIPMDAWRQFVRHRTLNVNEYSTRYSIAINSTQKTKPNEWRLQSKNNKQGSSGYLDAGSNATILDSPENEFDTHGNRNGFGLAKRERELHNLARQVYQERLDSGIAREQARKDLPLSTYTIVYVKNDLHNWFHFLKLRLDSHAQYEIRQYAKIIAGIIKEICPLAWEAFEDYILGGVLFSRKEQLILKKILEYDTSDLGQAAVVDKYMDKLNLSSREINEFFSKYNNLGQTITDYSLDITQAKDPSYFQTEQK